VKGAQVVEWDSSKLPAVSESYTDKGVDVSFGVQMWQHLATAIALKFLIEVNMNPSTCYNYTNILRPTTIYQRQHP
jgi:hypothetical protein